MRSKKWKEKEFSTETLTQVEVDEIMAGSDAYEQGKAPVSRNTQYAEDLGDIAELQKDRHSHYPRKGCGHLSKWIGEHAYLSHYYQIAALA